MIVPAPFNTTTAENCAASASAIAGRADWTSAAVLPNKRAASPGCGVKMKGKQTRALSVFFASNAARMLGFVEIALSASASITVGLSSNSTAISDAAPVSPMPMPTAKALIESSLTNTFASRTMISGCRRSNGGRCLSNSPRYTLPGPMCSAARAANTAAPVIPSAPPMTQTLP